MLNGLGSILQPGDKEDALGRILEARHPSGALLGTDSSQRPSPVESLVRYSSLVNQIHPERCMDGRAHRAFLRASQAFDALCAMDSGLEPGSWDADGSPKAWWESRSLADLQTFLEFRSAALKALYTEIAPNLGAPGMANIEHLNSLIEHGERTCEHLDRKKGIPRSRFWHAKPQPKRSAQEAAVHYVALLCHLWGMHCFCLLQGRDFVHVTDLQAASPLSKIGSLLQEALQRERSNQELQAKLAAQEDVDEDPLDRFMACLEEEAKEELSTLQHEGQVTAEVQEEVKEAKAARPAGKVGHLTAEAADAEKRAAASALLAEETKATAQRDLQNQLLGGLASDSDGDP